VSDRRAAVLAARRIVVKIGSSSLTRADGGLDTDRIDALAEVIAAKRRSGCEVVLVSSGAVAAGMGPLRQMGRPGDLAGLQAAASVGQGLLAHRYTEAFAEFGVTVGQVLLSADDVARRGHYRNAQRTMFRLLELGVLPVVNENDTVATDELRFGDNDRLAALVAHLVHADLLVLLSDVDGLYNGDPTKAASAVIPEVHGPADLDGVPLHSRRRGRRLGTGGMGTKVAAAQMATSDGVGVLLGAAGAAAELLTGADAGTWFPPRGSRRSTRLLWLAHATDGRGTLTLDPGAVAAVAERGASLLPAGIVAVTGSFVAGDAVDLADGDGKVVGRGLVNFDAAELPQLMGRSTKDLAAERGPAYEREVVHRDDLVLLTD
jgi:glutamate 5-kinase